MGAHRHRRTAVASPRILLDRVRQRPGVVALALAAVIALTLSAITPAQAQDRRATVNSPLARKPQPVAKPVAERGVASHHVTGIDVSDWQGTVDWKRVAAGAQFAYVKATEGTGFLSRTFAAQYAGAKTAGLYAGAYAFGRPDQPAVAQADFFVDQARWTRDGKTLPPMLDIEWPYSRHGSFVASYPCYGLSDAAMVGWIKAFVAEVRRRTGSATMIYTASGWWNQCTGGSSAFAGEPLFAASYNRVAPHLPKGWTHWAIWQFADRGGLPGDQDVLEGDGRTLAALATAAAPAVVLSSTP